MLKIRCVDENAVMPTLGHTEDAGLDLYAPMNIDVSLEVHDSWIIDTGVIVDIPKGYCGLMVSKSGLNTKYGITSTGLIDSGYTGTIRVKLERNDSIVNAKPYSIKGGDKISQLVILPIYPYANDIKVENEDTRGDNGFGSTGR